MSFKITLSHNTWLL